MDRTQKKCFVGVTVMHALLPLIVIIGTAFFNKEEKIADSPQILELINPNVTDGKTRGGAQAAISAEDVKPPETVLPKVNPPEPIPAKPEPEPQREQVVEPPKAKPVEPKETISEFPAPIKPKKILPKEVATPKPAEKVVAKPEPKKRKIDISNPTIRNNVDKKAAAEAADKAARENARLQVAASLKGAVSRLGQNLSSSTTVNLQGVSGDAGAVNYGDLVMKKYDDAWLAPNEVDDNEAIVKAKVVIARSGNVISADIVKASGNATLDKSVRRALELRFIHPFPEGSRDSQRTYIINFNLKTKRGIG
ncbi:MAG: TonB C-terminal domain-containing protein [Verrucomicrobiota bacterium]